MLRSHLLQAMLLREFKLVVLETYCFSDPVDATFFLQSDAPGVLEVPLVDLLLADELAAHDESLVRVHHSHEARVQQDCAWAHPQEELKDVEQVFRGEVRVDEVGDQEAQRKLIVDHSNELPDVVYILHDFYGLLVAALRVVLRHKLDILDV